MSALESSGLLFKYLSSRGGRRSGQEERLCDYDEAPSFLKTNPYIRSGYRGYSNVRHCVRSVFHWTNETLNIWTHAAGFLLFLYHILHNYSYGHRHPTFVTYPQRFLAFFQLCCYAVTMGSSVIYHTFCCLSHEAYRQCYRLDLIGVVFGSTANFVSGCFYFFECHAAWRVFYVSLMSLIGLVLFLSVVKSVRTDDPLEDAQRLFFISVWVASGLVLPAHYLYLHGGWTSHFGVILPRFAGFYFLTTFAFVMFVFRLPERLCPGSVDYVGHSHQWWHVVSAAALYWWYQSAVVFARYSNEQLLCLQ